MSHEPVDDAPSLLLDHSHVTVRSVPSFVVHNGRTGTRHGSEKTHAFWPPPNALAVAPHLNRFRQQSSIPVFRSDLAWSEVQP